MKLKFLQNLNALLIIWSLCLNLTTSDFFNKKEPIEIISNINNSGLDMYKENDNDLNKIEKLSEVNTNEHEILLEANPTKINTKNVVNQLVKYTLNEVKNPILQHDAKETKKITLYKKCVIKTGIINYVNKKDEVKHTINVTPTYIEINPHSINFYQSTDAKTLFLTIRLDHIEKLTDHFHEAKCVSIISKLENDKEKIEATICGKNIAEKDDWIGAISEFKECEIQIENDKDKAIDHFKKVKHLLNTKAKSTPKINTADDGLKELHYDNTKKVNQRNPINEAIDIKMRKQIKNIVRDIEIGNIAQKQSERQMQSKISKAEKIKKAIDKQKEAVKNMLLKRQQMEQEKKEVLLKKAAQKKEIQLVRAVGRQIKKEKQNEIKNSKETLKKKLAHIKGDECDSDKELALTTDKNKFVSYGLCTNPKLKNFKDKNYVSTLCNEWYGEHKFDECTQKHRFCDFCCSYHIGDNLLKHKIQCNKECNDIMGGISPKKNKNKKKN